jgi:hypothetical protein
MQIRVQSAVAPTRKHITNVDSNPTFDWINGSPSGAVFGGILRVGHALESRLSNTLKQQRQAVPIGMGTSSPVNTSIIIWCSQFFGGFGIHRCVMDHSKRTLAI